MNPSSVLALTCLLLILSPALGGRFFFSTPQPSPSPAQPQPTPSTNTTGQCNAGYWVQGPLSGTSREGRSTRAWWSSWSIWTPGKKWRRWPTRSSWSSRPQWGKLQWNQRDGALDNKRGNEEPNLCFFWLKQSGDGLLQQCKWIGTPFCPNDFYTQCTH